MSKLKVLDLFSGIGMFSYGLEKTDLYETVAFCEWDNKCQKVLRKHWPNVECYGDIQKLLGVKGMVKECYDQTHGYELYVSRYVDVITGGFPCQDISSSGAKTGLSGDRSSMWFHYLRLINDIKPKGVIVENVSALRHRGLREVLHGLNSVGYDAEWHSITAKHLGATHERDRTFILAYPTSIRQQKPWRPLESIYKEETRNRQTNIVQYALQRQSVPYLCGDHNVSAGRLDRLRQVGNTVYWPIVEQLGYHLHKNLQRMELVA